MNDQPVSWSWLCTWLTCWGMKLDRGKNKLSVAVVPGDDRCARLERALVLISYIVVRHGDAYAPYLDRLENELKAARRDDPLARARAILELYTVDVDAGPKRIGWEEDPDGDHDKPGGINRRAFTLARRSELCRRFEGDLFEPGVLLLERGPQSLFLTCTSI